MVRTDTGRVRPLRRILSLTACGACLVSIVVASTGAHGASSSTVVTMDVPSATTLTDQCSTDPARKFGVVQPGTPALTATGAGVCRFSFSSSNDSSMIRLSQRDQVGGAMAQTAGPFVAQRAWSNTYYTDVAVFDANTVMVTRPASVRSTTNGGSSWSEVCAACPATAWAGSIARNDANIRFAVGYAPDRVYKSVDAGVNWSPQAGASPEDLIDVDAVSDQVAFAVGDNGTIIRTLNGGTNWTTIAACPMMVGRQLQRVQAVSASVVWASGNGGVCRSTNANGGTPTFADASWVNNPMYVSAIDADVAWLTTGNEYAYRTMDGGVNWTGYSTQLGEGVTEIAAISASSVIVTGKGGLAARTTDTGATWSRMPGIGSNPSYDIAKADATTFYAVGTAATIAKSSNATTWDVQYEQSTTYRTFLDVEAATGDVAWAVAGDGLIRGTTNGGTNWNVQASGTTETLRRIESVSTTRAWAVGDLGTIVTTSDGATWSPQASGTTLTLLGVSAGDSTRVWVSGEDGLLLRTSTGGTAWTTIPSGITSDIKDVHLVAPGVVVYTTATGQIRRSIDSGSTWTTVLNTAGAPWGALDFASELVGYANGENDRIAVTSDGGATWTVSSTNGHATDLDAVSTSHAFFTTHPGEVGITTDRAATTSTPSIGGVMPRPLYGVAAVDAASFWLVGEGGAIIKRTAPTTISDYAGGANWASANTTSMFGVCLQAVGGSAAATWTVDTTGIVGQCQANDADPWRALPSAPSKVAGIAAAGASGSIDVVWGVRTAINQPPGDYAATVIAEVMAPNA